MGIGRMTALMKADGRGVRGIDTGNLHRRLVAKNLAQQFAFDIECNTPPSQFALFTRAGTEAMGHLLRAVTDSDDQAVVIAIDGIASFDHIRRRAGTSCYLHLL